MEQLTFDCSILEEDPLVEGDHYPGDLLTSVIQAGTFLVSRPEWLERLLGLAERAVDRLGTDDEELRREVASFIGRQRPERPQVL